VTAAAVILAAGGSTRMGQPKALLPVGGVSLLRRAVAAAAGCDPVVVVLGAVADRVRPELDGLAVTAVENPDWDQGPGTSIRVGLGAAGDADAAVLLACNQPLVDAAHICQLITAYRTGRRPMAASGTPARSASRPFSTAVVFRIWSLSTPGRGQRSYSWPGRTM
jgi:molybdenum cofactor cytidylyltransferase